MLSASFPRVTEYLARLPDGLDSYPECQTKGVVLASALGELPFHDRWDELPERVLTRMRSPPLATEWVPTVLTNAVQCAVADVYHPSDREVLAYNRSRTLKVANSTTYRALARVAGVKILMRGAVRMHSMFQRGTDFRLVVLGDRAVTLFLEHPPFLHGGCMHLANEAVFGTLIETAGGAEVSVRMTESSARRAVYAVSWR